MGAPTADGPWAHVYRRQVTFSEVESLLPALPHGRANLTNEVEWLRETARKGLHGKELTDKGGGNSLNGFGGSASYKGTSSVHGDIPCPRSPKATDSVNESMPLIRRKLLSGHTSESGDFKGQGAKCHQINFSRIDDVNAALARVDQLRCELLGITSDP